MREILFKAKEVDTSKWRYGFPWTTKSELLYFIKHKGRDFEIAPETICQYTGEKDNKDRKVFEGDVTQNGGIVKMIHGAWKVDFPEKEYSVNLVDWLSNDDGRFIVGNIHDEKSDAKTKPINKNGQ